MIDNESLKLSVYEYYVHSLKKSTRGVGLISDKQSIFYSQVLEGDNKTHENIITELEYYIHPGDKREGWDSIRDYNIHFFSTGEEFIMDLPKGDIITISQYNFLCEILDNVKKFNKSYPKYKIWFFISTDSKYLKTYNRFDAEDIKEKLKNLIVKDNKTIEEELIIGKINNKDEIIKNMIYTINLNSLDDLNDKIEIINRYYGDSFYHNYLLEILNYYNTKFNINILEYLKEFSKKK